MNRITYIIIFIAFSLLCSCSVTKQVPDNDALYTGADINLKRADKDVKLNKKDTKDELQSLLRPQPNKSILGIKFKLMIYNMVDTPKKSSGLKYWLKYKRSSLCITTEW